MVYIYSHSRVLCVKFGLLFPVRARRHSTAPPIFLYFFLCALCICLPIRVGFLHNFARDNSLVAVGSFTCAECMLHTGPRFIVSSERLFSTYVSPHMPSRCLTKFITQYADSNFRYIAGYFRVSTTHRTLTWTTGSLTCILDLLHACINRRLVYSVIRRTCGRTEWFF